MKLPDWYTQLLKTVDGWKRVRDRAFAAEPATVPTRSATLLPIAKKLSTHLIQVGVDYGTSWSKMVFRDYEAPGGEQSRIIFPDEAARIRGEFRFPSLVCLTDDRLWFGLEAVARAKDASALVWPSMKIRMALPDAYHGRDLPLPSGFAAADLAQLTVAYLLQHARRAVSAYCGAYEWLPRMTFTVGVPMSEFDNPELCDQFVAMARMASGIERLPSTPDLREGIRVDEARNVLEQGRASIMTPSVPDPRKWIRPEVEAALLWAFKSPDTTPGLYAAVDVGAGTTSASFFYITQSHENGMWVKAGMAFFGASCLPPGADAIDEALANWASEEDPAQLRGHENEFIVRSGETPIECITDQIVETYRLSFRRAYRKDMRQSAWEGFRMFLIGGGTGIDSVRASLRAAPWQSLRTEPEVMDIGYPEDLQLETVRETERKFLLVAYGLSHIDVDIPSAATPSDVPPLVLGPRRIVDLDRDNPDEFRPGHT